MAPLAADRLDGWKAIADYLARDIRTLQRWRDERGLPIHRVPGSKGGTVFAYPAELDAWLRESPTVKKEESAAVVAESVESLTLAPFDSLALARHGPGTTRPRHRVHAIPLVCDDWC